jgi:hypothetical protein
VAGPSQYPRIAQRDPTQWSDGWIYPSGCPPVPAVTGLRARPGSGSVDLSWANAGLGIRYRVYLLEPRYALAAATSATSVTLRGLTPGPHLAQVVPVNARKITGPYAQVWFSEP